MDECSVQNKAQVTFQKTGREECKKQKMGEGLQNDIVWARHTHCNHRHIAAAETCMGSHRNGLTNNDQGKMKEMLWGSLPLAAELFAIVRFMGKVVIAFSYIPTDDTPRMQWIVLILSCTQSTDQSKWVTKQKEIISLEKGLIAVKES